MKLKHSVWGQLLACTLFATTNQYNILTFSDPIYIVYITYIPNCSEFGLTFESLSHHKDNWKACFRSPIAARYWTVGEEYWMARIDLSAILSQIRRTSILCTPDKSGETAGISVLTRTVNKSGISTLSVTSLKFCKILKFCHSSLVMLQLSLKWLWQGRTLWNSRLPHEWALYPWSHDYPRVFVKNLKFNFHSGRLSSENFSNWARCLTLVRCTFHVLVRASLTSHKVSSSCSSCALACWLLWTDKTWDPGRVC